MPSGHTGSGWALYGTTTPSSDNIIIASNYCHLGTNAEAFDTELQAVHQGLLYILNSDLKPCHLILCIDNSAAIHTLADNLSNLELAFLAICLAMQLTAKGWTSSPPAHPKIKGNEEVNGLAKKGPKRLFIFAFMLLLPGHSLEQSQCIVPSKPGNSHIIE
jgi:hypothetical protein